MIILNIIMWSVSTAHAAVSFDEKFMGFLRENGAQNPLVFENNAAPRVFAQLSLECVNVCSSLTIGVDYQNDNTSCYSSCSETESFYGERGYSGNATDGYFVCP